MREIQFLLSEFYDRRPPMRSDWSRKKLSNRVSDESQELTDAVERNNHADILEETVDVMLEAINLLTYMGIDNIEALLAQKIRKNETRFPVEVFRFPPFEPKYAAVKKAENGL